MLDLSDPSTFEGVDMCPYQEYAESVLTAPAAALVIFLLAVPCCCCFWFLRCCGCFGGCRKSKGLFCATKKNRRRPENPEDAYNASFVLVLRVAMIVLSVGLVVAMLIAMTGNVALTENTKSYGLFLETEADSLLNDASSIVQEFDALNARAFALPFVQSLLSGGGGNSSGSGNATLADAVAEDSDDIMSTSMSSMGAALGDVKRAVDASMLAMSELAAWKAREGFDNVAMPVDEVSYLRLTY